MGRFSFFLLLSIVPIAIVIIQQSSSALTIDQKTFLEKMLSITGKLQETVEELRCPENWSQFGYSCYLLSDYMSTVVQANHTCDLFHLKDSRLMYIQQPVELIYAAHKLTKNNLNNLLLEVDQDLMKGARIVNMLSSNDDIQWKEFGKKILQDNFKKYKEKTQSSKHLSRKDKSSDDNTIDRESITVKGKIENDNKDQNKLENVDDIRKSCHEIKWNVADENSNVLILTVEMDSNKSICSLSNINSEAAYSHLCQYVLDRCLNNMMCGEYGRCVNSQTGFKCSCSFLYDGFYCEKNKRKEIIGAVIFLVISILITFEKPRRFLWYIIKGTINCCRGQQTTPSSSSFSPPPPSPVESTYNENNVIQGFANETVEWATTDHGSDKIKTTFDLTTKEQCLRNTVLVILTIVFFLVLVKLPTIDHVKVPPMNNTTLSKVDSLIDDNIHKMGQYTRSTIFQMDNFIFLLVSTLLVVLFSIINLSQAQDQIADDDRPDISLLCSNLRFSLVIEFFIQSSLEPIKLFHITDRFKTAMIIVIQMFEILEILEETLIDIDQSAQSGVLAGIGKRMFFVILIALRYYPTLVSLQFQNSLVRLLTLLYFAGSTAYMTIYKSSGVHWIPFLIEIFSSKHENLHMDPSRWSFIYGTGRNILHCFLIGYIGAELTVRLFYDSIHITRKETKSVWKILYKKIDQYSFLKEDMEKIWSENSNEDATIRKAEAIENDNSDQQGYWFRIRKSTIDFFRKYTGKIYKWENNFRFTTIAVCTYAIAYIFLLHLTGTLILLYTTQTKSYIHYTKYIFERILNIEVKEWSFQREVVISAFITMIIYGIQLFLSIKKYRKSMRDAYSDMPKDIKSKRQPNKHDIIQGSIKYPGYLLLHLFGGVFICFHLILFIVIVLSGFRMIRTPTGSVKRTSEFIIPALILCLLQIMIIRWPRTLLTLYHERDKENVKFNKLDSILLYFYLIAGSFIGIIWSIIRLIVSVLVNIVFMSRLEYSCVVEPVQTLDKAHMAFICFVRLETLCTHPLVFDLSGTTKPTPTPGIPPNETDAVQVEQDDYHDAENNPETQTELHAVNRRLQNNYSAGTLTSEPSSQLSSRRSSIHVYEPMPPNGVLNTDEELTAALLPK